jgi:alanine racemase
MLHPPPSRIEISKQLIEENFNEFKRILPKKMAIAPVLKSNAYGHGLPEVTSIVKGLAPMICVYEGFELKKVRTVYPGPVLILGPVDPVEVVEIHRLKPVFSVFSIPYLRQLDEIGRALGKSIDVHIAIDALFGREGIMPIELPSLFETLRACSWIKVEGVFAHFSSADEAGQDTSKRQLGIYLDIVEAFHSKGYQGLITHIASTAGAIGLAKEIERTHMIRLGLGLFGLWPSTLSYSFHPEMKLSPALRWISWVAQVKDLPKDHPIGYNRTFISNSKTKIALIPQGYGHGYPRSASNQGWVIIRGTRCYIKGRISMNSLVVDVSHLPAITQGEPVLLLGREGDEGISADQLAEMDQTINYDIVVRISSEIPRVIV